MEEVKDDEGRARPRDMTGIPRRLGEHRLNINPDYPPIRQKKRFMAKQRNEVVNKEVADLVQAGVLRPTQFPQWVANPVMVKKGGRNSSNVRRLYRFK